MQVDCHGAHSGATQVTADGDHLPPQVEIRVANRDIPAEEGQDPKSMAARVLEAQVLFAAPHEDLLGGGRELGFPMTPHGVERD